MFLTMKTSTPCLVATSFISEGHRQACPWGYRGQGVRLTTNLHLTTCLENVRFEVHGRDYEECPLRYKTPVRTSRETHYFSVTQHSRLMLFKILCFHGGDYEEWRLLGYYAMWLL
jgi:hypothetical protein